MTDLLRRGLRAAFGELRWQAPPWLTRLGKWRTARPGVFWACVALVVALPAAGYLVAKWLPEPVLTRVQVDPPGVTPIGPDGNLYPRPALLRFSTEYPDARDAGPRDAARLDLVGRELDQGVTLTPAADGVWSWQDARTLRFEPAQDWPAGQTYRVRLDPAVLADDIELEDTSPTFTTPAIEPTLEKLEFYQNPEAPSEHRVVATLAFTHAVDADSLREHLSLSMRSSDDAVEAAPVSHDFELELGEHRRQAYVTTPRLQLPQRESFMTLELAAGVAAALGPSTTSGSLRQDVRVPSVDTFFRIGGMSVRIVRDDDDDPEQTLVADFTVGVATEDVAEHLEAWVLPMRNRRWQRDEVDAELLARSQSLTLDANPAEHDHAPLQSFTFDAPERRQLFVRLSPGLVSLGDFEMTVPYSDIFQVPDYPREARVVGEGAWLALAGDRELSFQARGVPALRVELFRLLDDQLTHLVTQTRGDLSQARFSYYGFDEDNLGARIERVLPLNADDPAEAVYASLDLEPFLSEAGRGVFVVRVDGWDPEREQVIPRAGDRRLVLVTNLSLIAKDHADGSHAVFVHSLADQGPVADAGVELLGVNGRPVLTRRTDARGFAAMPDVGDLEDEKRPAVYLVRHEGDVSFLPFDRADRHLELSRFDTGGVRTPRGDAARALQAEVFSDRGIYRPGEDGHLGVMVKRQDWGPVADVPVEVVVSNPRGNSVMTERLALPADGFVELPVTFAATAPTGGYHARVYLLDEDDQRRTAQIGATVLSVEEFQPDTLRIRTAISGGEQPGWRTLEQYQGDVRLENLFGLPAQGRRVEGSFTLTPVRFRFQEYAGYVFEDPFRDDDRLEQSVTEALPEQASNADGEASFDIDVSGYGAGLFRLTFSAQGYEPGGGRSVSARSAALVSPAELLVGWKADGDLGYLRQGGERRIDFVAVNPALESVAAELTLRLVEKRPVSTLVRQDDGTLAYQTVVRREVADPVPFAVESGGTAWTVPTGTAGEFAAEMVGDDGRVLARVEYSVVGERNLAGRTETEGALEVKLDQDSYAAGAEIELQITAPYTGSGLITIERDRVYAHRWFRTTGTSTVERIRLPEDLEGNAYVNVTFVRALDAEEIFTSPLSYAVAPFDIDRRRRTVSIDLDVPERVKPGDRLDIAVDTSQPARVAVYAVDEGILQVAGYRTPRPLDTFLRKRALEVTTSQMADLLMPEFRLLEERMAPGGGEGARAALGANLNPFQRGVEAPVVYWSGIVEVGEAAHALDFTVPDHFDGRLRIMAVASADGAAGSTDTDTVVRGPFVLQPNVITMAAPGDQFEVSVGVTNALDDGGEREIEVRLEPDEHLAVVGEATRSLNLGPGREGRARFTVRVGDNPGAAALRFHASAGEHELSRTSTLSVRPPVPHRTTLNAGIGDDGEGSTELERRLLPQLAEQQAAVGYGPLILAGGLQEYLDGFPHACSEQIVSGVFPAVALMNDPALGLSQEATLEKYRDVVASLQARQLGNGGFGFWPGAAQADDFVTIYAMHFLTDAGESGVPVPSEMLSTGLDRTRALAAATDTAQGRSAFLQAYAIYVLTRNGRVTTNYLTRLQEFLDSGGDDAWRSTLTASYMAAAYRMLKLDDLAGELVGGYRYADAGSDYQSDMDSALARNAQYLYLLARHFPERLEAVDDERIRRVVAPITEGRYNTLSSAYAMLALGAWGRAAGEGAEGQLRILAENDSGARQTLATGQPPVLRAEVPTGTRRVDFEADADTRLFHTVTQSGYDTELPEQPQRRGLEVVRELVNDDGEVVNGATLGDELTVRVRVRALDNRRHPNVAVVDLLPGGFEVLRESIRGGTQGWATDYVDIREDRVVAYGTVTAAAQTFSYRVKVTGAGELVVPPVFAESMYHPDLQAQSAAGRFSVERP